ncbi:MAG TPA: hypothetical protein VGK55_15120 [Actinomycetes bacterium]
MSLARSMPAGGTARPPGRLAFADGIPSGPHCGRRVYALLVHAGAGMRPEQSARRVCRASIRARETTTYTLDYTFDH